MATNLRARFRERQHKRLSDYIVISPSPSKKACPTPRPNSLSMPTLSTPTDAITSGLNEKPSSVCNIPYHEMRKPFLISGSINEESFECPHLSPHCPKTTYVPSREKMFELLRCFLSFTENEPPMQDMGTLFSATQSSPFFSLVTFLVFPLVSCFIMIFAASRS
ncbi:hypothetical protein PVL29_018551 [Vitis rotundifolia]|uniref:Uncharacterized protein n=1 Tax=Vitis rotundifolia TaxID=103349 RepID=A0AA38Z5L5_VITRO|nr:hypothetical protein PVL29_018551 [Vitis rotundifolia]